MRTRFAPSPTGFLHVGGLRTALYAYLLAKQSRGKFLLRIEDTDQERSVPGAVENILRTLHWAGLSPDEGVMMRDGKVMQEGAKGPYIQSERLPLYREYAQKLLEAGHAYPCFCSPERLESMRKRQQENKQAPMYDRLCLSLSTEELQKRLSANEPHVLRLKMPRDREISFVDEIRGPVSFRGDTIDDQVLLKSDGFPTYHLAHVVDDHFMEIDLVLRGEEWLSSTPKHIVLFECLGWTPPKYAHVALLLNKDKSKLSKRQNDVAAEDYITKGYLPEALLNFLALLGWNPGTTQEIFSLEGLIAAFSLEHCHKAGAIFDLEKLDWLQGQWVRTLPPEQFAANILPLVEEKYPAAKADKDFGTKAALIQERIVFFHEAPTMLSFFYEEPTATMEVLANKKQKVTPEDVPTILGLLTETLTAAPEWSAGALEKILTDVIEAKGYKRGQVLWVLRAAVTGLPFSPGAYEVAAALGKEKTLRRLQAALQ